MRKGNLQAMLVGLLISLNAGCALVESKCANDNRRQLVATSTTHGGSPVEDAYCLLTGPEIPTQPIRLSPAGEALVQVLSSLSSPVALAGTRDATAQAGSEPPPEPWLQQFAVADRLLDETISSHWLAPVEWAERLSIELTNLLLPADIELFEDVTGVGLIAYLEMGGFSKSQRLWTLIDAIKDIDSAKHAELTAAYQSKDAEQLMDLFAAYRRDQLGFVLALDEFPDQSLKELQQLLDESERGSFRAYLAEADRSLVVAFEQHLAMVDASRQAANASVASIRKAEMDRSRASLASDFARLGGEGPAWTGWQCKGIAFSATQDRSVRQRLKRILAGRQDALQRERTRAVDPISVGHSRRLPLYSSEDYALILSKSNGWQCAMPLVAVANSPLGSIHVADRDRLTICRWPQLPLPRTNSQISVMTAVREHEMERESWHDAALFNIELLGRPTQFIFPIDLPQVSVSAAQRQAMIPADSHFIYHNLNALPVVVASRLRWERLLHERDSKANFTAGVRAGCGLR